MDTLSPPLAPPTPHRYNVLGVELSRETLSLVALALAAGIVVGARIQRSAQRLHGCEECERQRLETARSIARGARDFEELRRRAGGGGGTGGSEGVSMPPPPPSPAAPETVESPQGGSYPFIPPERDPLDLDEVFEEPHAPRE